MPRTHWLLAEGLAEPAGEQRLVGNEGARIMHGNAESLKMILRYRRPRYVLFITGLVGSPSSITVAMSGVPGDMAAQLQKRLSAKGVDTEHILFCDFF